MPSVLMMAISTVMVGCGGGGSGGESSSSNGGGTENLIMAVPILSL